MQLFNLVVMGLDRYTLGLNLSSVITVWSFKDKIAPKCFFFRTGSHVESSVIIEASIDDPIFKELYA